MRPPAGLPLRGRKVTVRRLLQRDAPAVRSLVPAGESSAWGPQRGPFTAVEADELVRAWRLLDGQVSLVIDEAGGLRGGVTLLREDRGVWEAGYWVAPEARGRGIATEALTLTAAWAGRALAARRLWLEIDPGNAASLRVAEKAGFTCEGLVRRHCRDWATGVERDCVIWSYPGAGLADGRG